MGNEKTVAFRIEINGTEDQVRKMASIRTAIADLTNEVKKAGVAKKQGQLTEDEYNQAVIRLNQQLKTEQTELRTVTTEVQRGNQVFRAQSGSIVELTNALNLNIQRYREMSAAERNSETGGKQLIRTIQQQDAELKKMNATLGRHQMNVGNYPQIAGQAFAKVGAMLKTLAAGFIAAFSIRAISGFFTGSMEKYDKQISAETKLASVLKATGNTVNFTTDELKKMASAMQEVTRYGDEEIINAQAILLTFRSIGRDIFPDVIKVAADMTSVLGTDLQGAVLQLGKAFNDPLTGLTALRRAGVSFSQEQTAHIKNLTETGRLYEAQKLILEELRLEFGGTAEAMAGVGKGPLKQLSNLWGDFMEKVGGAITTGGPFSGLIENLKTLVIWMNENVNTVMNIAKGIGILLQALVIYKVTVMATAAAQKVWNDAKAVQLLFTRSTTKATQEATVAQQVNRTATQMGTAAVQGQAIATEGAAIAQKSLNTAIKSNPIGLILSVIATVVAVIWELVSAMDKAESGFERFTKNMMEETGAMNNAFEMLKKTTVGTKERADAVRIINEKYGEYLPNLLTEKMSLIEIEKAQRAATQALIANIAAKAKEADMTEVMQKYSDEFKSYNDKIISDVIDGWGAAAGGIAQSQLMKIFEKTKTQKLDYEIGGGVNYYKFYDEAREMASILSGGTYDIDRWAQAIAGMTETYQKQQTELQQLTSFYDAYIGTIQTGTTTAGGGGGGTGGGGGDDAAKKALEAQKKLLEDRLKLIEENQKLIEELMKDGVDAQIAIMEEGLKKEIEIEYLRQETEATKDEEARAKQMEAIEREIEFLNSKAQLSQAEADQLAVLEEQKYNIRVYFDYQAQQEAMANAKKMKDIVKGSTKEQIDLYRKFLEDKIAIDGDMAWREKEMLAILNRAVEENNAEMIAKIEKQSQEGMEQIQQNTALELAIARGALSDKTELAKAEKKIQADTAKATYDLLMREYEARLALGTLTKEQQDDLIKRLVELRKQIDAAMDVKTGKAKRAGFGTDVESWLSKLLGITDAEAKTIYDKAFEVVTNIANMILEIQRDRIQQQLEAEIKMYDDQAAAEQKKLETQKEQGLISEAYYQAEQMAIQTRYAALKNAADKKAFENMKDQKQAELWINYAAAVIQLYAENHWIVATVLAGLLAVEAGLQSAAISNQTWTPRYEFGGVVQGPSHAQGGVPIEAEGGEGMINRRSMASPDRMTVTGTPAEIASAINSYKGYGRPFTRTGSHYYMDGGRIVPTPSPGQGQTAASKMDLMALGQFIVNGINKSLTISEKEITDAQDRRKVREAASTW